MVLRFLGFTAAAIATFAAALVVRALLIAGPRHEAEPPLAIDAGSPATRAMADRLGQAIRIETISAGAGGASDGAEFAEFLEFLERSYPAVFASTAREVIGGNSLVLRWPGADETAAPIALIAHIDVVPVEAGTAEGWSHPPFSGATADGAVWGRGAMDDKGPLIAIMEAAEQLAGTGFAPRRDVYLLFGHDEELGGAEGAAAIADVLRSRAVRFEWTLDEGSGVVQGVIPGVVAPIALISVAEKGSTTLKLSATAEGGHSSAPGRDTAVSLVSRAVVALADEPFPLEIDGDFVAFLHAIAPELPFLPRLVLANLWATAPLVKAQLGRDPATAAALRTTTAPTIISGGEKTNVLPQRAEAYVNFRIHPRDSAEGVLERARSLIDDDRIDVVAVGAREPSPKSSTISPGYAAIARTTARVFGAPPTAPFLTLQGTDTRNYIGLADDHYRFAPFI